MIRYAPSASAALFRVMSEPQDGGMKGEADMTAAIRPQLARGMGSWGWPGDYSGFRR